MKYICCELITKVFELLFIFIGGFGLFESARQRLHGVLLEKLIVLAIFCTLLYTGVFSKIFKNTLLLPTL